MEDRQSNTIRSEVINKAINYIFDHIDEDGVVYVQLLGACIGCGLADVTVKMGIESILMDEIPEVSEVRVID